MSVLRRLRQLEAGVARAVERAAYRWVQPGAREPLEIAGAILDAIADRVEPASRGRHVFPYNRIRVLIAASSRDVRMRYAAVLEGEQGLHEKIEARLREAGCEPPALRVSAAYVDHAAGDWLAPEFHLEFDRVAAVQPPAPRPAPQPALMLAVVNGAAERRQYAFTLARVNLGRCAELRDSLNRLVRTNHVAFTEGPGSVNETVSRRHARIDYGARTRQYRIADDRSAHGTSVVRGGRTLAVAAGTRGLRLASGDEIVLGEARLRVRIGPSGPNS